jgi:hypothetical protein
VPLQGNLAVAGRGRPSPGRRDFSPAGEPGSKESTPSHYRAFRGAGESSPSVNPLQGSLDVITG